MGTSKGMKIDYYFVKKKALYKEEKWSICKHFKLLYEVNLGIQNIRYGVYSFLVQDLTASDLIDWFLRGDYS